MYKNIGLLTTLLLVASCNAAKKPIETSFQRKPIEKKQIVVQDTKKPTIKIPTKGINDPVIMYIEEYKNVAMDNMRKFGIPASIVLAQGILESGAGKSELTQIANNHFGIKCNSDWLGETVRHDDDTSQECFRKYKKPSESYDDHSRFLTSKSRYASLFSLPKGDYEAWAKGLRAAGYATDPQYPQKLIMNIEKYQLNQYDDLVLGKETVYTNNTTQNNTPIDRKHQVEKGDTLYSLSKKYNISVEELISKNNIKDNILSVGQYINY
jgi:flagellum-specific peptidoglycan hydrolase FlgJ